MKKYMLLVLWILSACTTPDPYTQLGAAQAAITATSIENQVRSQETAGAINAAAAESTRYAAEAIALDAEVRATQAAIGAEETRVALQSTTAAGDLEATAARATSQVIEMQSTQAYLTEYTSAMSTATTEVNQRELQATAQHARMQRASALGWIGVLLTGGLVLGFLFSWGILLYAWYLRSRYNYAEKMTDLRATYYTPAQLSPGLPSDNGRRDILEFLANCSIVSGEDATTIPSDDKLGMSAGPWTRRVTQLRDAGAVYTVPNTGTFIKLPWRTIKGLHAAIASGSLQLRPPHPTAPASRLTYKDGNGNGNGDYENEFTE